MKSKLLLVSIPIFSILLLGNTLPAHADVLLDGDYDSTSTNPNQIDSVATNDANANELSLSTFESLVESAFLSQSGGVITFNSGESISWVDATATPSNIAFSDATVLATIQRTVSGTDVVNDAATTDRTPISGTHTFGGATDYGFVFDAADQINAVGLTVISRDGQTAGTATITATFADINGLNTQAVAASDTLAGGNATDDTFFGFTAPTGKYLTELRIQTPYFTRIDDLGIVTQVPEPGSLALSLLGSTLLLARLRR